MTQQSDEQKNKSTPPEIISEEDMPFDSSTTEDTEDGISVQKPKDTSLSAEKPAKDMDSLKFTLGSSTLGWCIFLMIVCVIISLWQPDNELVKNGFEAFKLIVMTILGYIFGSNNTKHG